MDARLVGTYFVNSDGKILGDYPELLAIPLYKGMTITIHSLHGEFEVVDWHYHHGHPDELNGLHIVLE